MAITRQKKEEVVAKAKDIFTQLNSEHEESMEHMNKTKRVTISSKYAKSGSTGMLVLQAAVEYDIQEIERKDKAVPAFKRIAFLKSGDVGRRPLTDENQQPCQHQRATRVCSERLESCLHVPCLQSGPCKVGHESDQTRLTIILPAE